MKKNILLILSIFILSSCSSIFPERKYRLISHPALPKTRILCTDCHNNNEDKISSLFESLEHTASFIDNHKIYVVHEEEACTLCHKQNFCITCHANKDITLPSYKNGERPDRVYPHEGDYIIRHRIDGKILSDRCFKCHGRKNNRTCKACHKQ